MKYISHRGNLTGKCNLENDPKNINKVLDLGFDVEVDVWVKNNNLYLGHDKPTYEISYDFLSKNGLWCHAKNYEALNYLLNNNIHCFWHENDKYTITSQSYIWAYPSYTYDNGVIAVLPENNNIFKLNHCLGICSDYIHNYKEQLWDK